MGRVCRGLGEEAQDLGQGGVVALGAVVDGEDAPAEELVAAQDKSCAPRK